MADSLRDHQVPVRRHISPQAGRALEILGHAIEYLTDELVLQLPNKPPSHRDGRIEAISLLMSVNRQIYLACPEAPRLRDRILGFLLRRRLGA